MASFYSRPAEYGSYTQPINLDLVNFVLSSKQQKYDYNIAKLEDKITNQLGSIDLARTQDKEYFLNRASEVLNSMGDISKLDYSKNGVTRQIDGRINSIVDDRIVNDVMSTRNYRSFQSTLQEKQKKGDGTYSAENAAHAMEVGGVNSWLRGTDTKGNSVDGLGTVAYQDFVDVNAELKDISENLNKYARVVKKFTMDGMYFVTQNGKELTSSEVKSMASQLLSDKAKSQMRINGWAAYDGGEQSSTATQVAGRFGKFAESQYAEVNKDIADLQMKSDAMKDSNPELSKAYADEVTSLTEYKTKLTSDYTEWIKSPEKSRHNMSTTMEMETTLTNFGKAFAINDVGDPVYSANPVKQAEITNKFRAADLAIKQATYDKEHGAGSVTAVDAPYSLKDTDTAQQVPLEISKNNKQFEGSINQLYNNLTAEQRTVIDDQASKSTEGSLSERRFKAMDALDYRSISDQDLLLQTRELQRELNTKKEIYGDALLGSFSEVEGANVDTMVREYYDNPYMKFVNPDTGKMETVSGYLYRAKVGKDDGKLLLGDDKKQTFSHLLKSYYADKIVSSGSWSRVKQGTGAVLMTAGDVGPIPGLGGVTRAIGASLLGSEASDSREIKMFSDRLVALYTQDGFSREVAEDKAKDYLNKVESAGAYDDNKIADAVTDVLSVTPFSSTINRLNPNNSVIDTGVLNKWITLDKIDAKTGSRLNNSTEIFSERQRAFVVRGETSAGQALASIVQSKYVNLNPDSAVKLDIGKGMSMSIKSKGGGIAEISGLKSLKSQEYIANIDIKIADLPPAILEQIDFESAKISYSEKNMRPTNRAFTFSGSDDLDQIKFVERKMGWREYDGVAITKQNTIASFQKKYTSQIGTYDKPTDLGTAVTNMVNANNLIASIVEVQGKFYKQLGVSNGRDVTAIYKDQFAINPANYETAVRNMDIAPTIFVRTILDKALQAQLDEPGTEPSLLKNIKTHYGAKQ